RGGGGSMPAPKVTDRPPLSTVRRLGRGTFAGTSSSGDDRRWRLPAYRAAPPSGGRIQPPGTLYNNPSKEKKCKRVLFSRGSFPLPSSPVPCSAPAKSTPVTPTTELAIPQHGNGTLRTIVPTVLATRMKCPTIRAMTVVVATAATTSLPSA